MTDARYKQLYILIPVLTFIVYMGVLRQHYINYDDDWYIWQSPYVTGMSWDRFVELMTRPFNGQYSPVPPLCFAALYKIGGGSPGPMKLAALLNHVLNAFLVFLLIRKLTKHYRAAFFVSALFALHPMQVESVAWLTAIFRIGAGFILASMLLYIKFIETRGRRYYAGVIVCYTLAFLSKEQSAVLPVLLFLVDYAMGRNMRERKIITEKIPLLGLAVVFAFITLSIAASGHNVAGEMTFIQKIYMMSLALGSYTWKLLVPTGLSFAYIHPRLAPGLTVAEIVVPIVVVAGLLAAIYSMRRLRTGMFGVLFYLVLISMSLTFAVTPLRDTFMADRYVYLASVGLFAFFYVLLTRFIAARPRVSGFVHIAAAGYIVFMAALSYGRVPVFDNSVTVWTDALRKDPNNFLAWYNRGHFYETNRNPDQAIHDYQASIAARPGFYWAQYNLGHIYLERGDLDKALEYMNQAIDSYGDEPRAASKDLNAYDYLNAYNNRAVIYASTNRPQEALADLDFVLSREPGHTDALTNRALLLFNLGEFEKSLRDLDRLLRSNPNNAASLNIAGLCYTRLGKLDRAIGAFDRAIAADPRNGAVWLNRSHAHNMAGDRSKALSDAMRAAAFGAQVDPAYLDALRD